MSDPAVARLYDALHRFESRYHSGRAYPVHKRLVFDEPSTEDIYDWIAAEVGLPDQGAILDAGCGVGYGTTRIAERCFAQVTGISASQEEIRTAQRNAGDSAANERLEYCVGSFDELPGDAYELIIAVESLKHSEDLAKTLDTLYSALRAGGQLVIVEDCYTGPPDDDNARQVVRSWGLTRLYTESDYLALPGVAQVRVVELTARIRRFGLISRAWRRFVPGVLRLFGGRLDADAAAAFAGGIYHERLYDAGHMQYKALVVTAPDREDDA